MLDGKKFKIGNKVKIINPNNHHYNALFKGKIGKII